MSQNTIVQQLLKEHDQMRRVLVQLAGTEDRQELNSMAVMLPLVVTEQREKQVLLDAVQVLLDVPHRDERVEVGSIL